KRTPPIRPRAGEARFRGDENIPIRMQRFMNEPLGDIRSVRIRRIDEVDAELRQTLQRADRFLPILRLAPDAGPGETHRAKAEPVNADVAADIERAGWGGTRCGAHASSPADFRAVRSSSCSQTTFRWRYTGEYCVNENGCRHRASLA